MFGFGSSSSKETEISSTTPAAPTREERKACWENRDAYFGCLEKNGILVAGSPHEGRICEKERKGYEGSCSKSWIEYFNKRRTLEMRQKATQEAAARARDSNLANQGR